MPRRQTLRDLLFSVGAVKQDTSGQVEALSYIDGQWVRGLGEEIEDLSPTTNKPIGMFHDCTPEQVDLAFQASRVTGKWWNKRNQTRKKDFSIPEFGVEDKADALDRFLHLLEEHQAELALLISQDMGKTIHTADADVKESIHAAKHYRNILDTAMKGESRETQAPNKDALSGRFPYGTVLTIKPFNFIALYWWSICAGITGGNTAVVKASRDIPFIVNATVALFHRALSDVFGGRAERLASLVQVLQGRGSTTGNYMAEHGDYDMISFTGSNEIAQELQVTCARRNKRFHRETGGHAAIAVLDDFNLEKASDEIVQAAFGDSGQRCTSTKVVFAQDTIYDELLALVIEKAKKLRIGDPTILETKVAPLINAQAFDAVCQQLNRTERALGRKPVLGGIGFKSKEGLRRAQERGFNVGKELSSGEIPHNNNFLTPTIFADVPYGVCAMDEEIFGPVLVFNKVSGTDPRDVLENAIDLINQSRYGLSNSVLTNEMPLIMWARNHIMSGVRYFGRGTTGAEVPGYFSVVKESGDGYEAYGIKEYTWVAQDWIDYHPTTRLAQTRDPEELKREMKRAKSDSLLS